MALSTTSPPLPLLPGARQPPAPKSLAATGASPSASPTSSTSGGSGGGGGGSSSAEEAVHYVKIDASCQLDEEFQLGETLGEGAFGHVLLAVRRRDGEKFAVKKLAKLKDTRSTYGKSWENEIRVLRRFQHPGIVQLEVIYESEDNCFLFLELCDAGTLCDELGRRGRFEEADAKCLLRQVGSALSFLHKSRVVHRDLKLQNCLLRRRGGGGGDTRQPHSCQAGQQRRSRAAGQQLLGDSCPLAVKLTDFGLSIELRDLDQSLADNVGTPAYQAPEIVSGSSYTFKCDVWAFGVLAFSMLHGRSPYAGLADSADLADAIKAFDFGAACADCGVCAGLSRECRDCLLRLLLPSQVERWSAAEFLGSAWATDTRLPDGGPAEGGSILEMMRSMNCRGGGK